MASTLGVIAEPRPQRMVSQTNTETEFINTDTSASTDTRATEYLQLHVGRHGTEDNLQQAQRPEAAETDAANHLLAVSRAPSTREHRAGAE